MEQIMYSSGKTIIYGFSAGFGFCIALACAFAAAMALETIIKCYRHRKTHKKK